MRKIKAKNGLIPDGNTTFYTMIGSPVSQVKSPIYFNKYFVMDGHNAVMIAMDIPADQVSHYLESMKSISNFGGCIVTVPHKEAAAKCMDELTPRAEELSCVNVVRNEKRCLIGDMVDGLGFKEAVQKHGLSLKSRRVAIIGGGSAGMAIAQAISESGVKEIVVKELRTQRYPFLEQLMKNANPNIRVSFELENLEGFQLIINASPIGMNGDPNLPFPTETLHSETLVADIVTNPKVTPWLNAAIAKGCDVLYGEEMVQGQFGLMGRHLGLEILHNQR